MNREDEKIYKLLLELFPDKKVINIGSNKRLYSRVNSVAKPKGIEVIPYIKSLGFEYEKVTNKKSVPYDEGLSYILDTLAKTFPDKIISHFNNRYLYKEIYQYTYNFCVKHKIDRKQLLADLGYTIRTSTLNSINFQLYDALTLNKLIDTFNLDVDDTIRLFKISLNEATKVIDNPKKANAHWEHSEFKQDVLAIFKIMICQRIKYHIEDNNIYYIFSNRDINNPTFALLHTSNKMKLAPVNAILFNIPSNLEALLIQHHFHLLGEDELLTVHEITEENELCALKNSTRPLTYKNRAGINYLIFNHPQLFQNISDVLNYFNWDYLKDVRDKAYEEMYEVLKPFYIPELDCIRIPKELKIYTTVSNAAARANVLLQDYIMNFGFQTKGKLSGKELKLLAPEKSSLEVRIEKAKRILLNNYMIDTENKIVFIPIRAKIHLQLIELSVELEKDLDEMLAEWGFSRKYDTPNVEQDENDSDTIEDFLGLLNNLEQQVGMGATTALKWARSKKLVNTLKEMYDFKCQLCDPLAPVEAIIMSEGKQYVEVHHILSLHHQDKFSDGSDVILDSFKNAMVVCPHHHKYLHYHRNGFVEIQQIKNQLYFVNEEEEKVLIPTNYHLEANKELIQQFEDK